jgi:hypothetical protein
MAMVLMTQYFDMMKEVAGSPVAAVRSWCRTPPMPCPICFARLRNTIIVANGLAGAGASLQRGAAS